MAPGAMLSRPRSLAQGIVNKSRESMASCTKMEPEQHIAKLVQTGSAQTVCAASCHKCGGSLQIQYADTTKRVLSIMCLKCIWRVVTDGIENEPSWVSVLGKR